MKNILITTAIDYVNAQPHIGHAVEKVQADVLARYYRSEQNEVFFLTGADENSLKNVLAAKKEGKDTAEFVAENTSKFEELKPLLNLSHDKFIKTTSIEHFDGCKKFWRAMKQEDIYKKNYTGFYCVGCEEFKTEKDLIEGKCPEHQSIPEKVEEENYFFKLSNYQGQLLNIIESNKVKIVPDFRRNEVLSFIKNGLEDFSISRSRERACNWGVPVPGDDSQIMYVWVDALANYITALGYADNEETYQKFWSDENQKIHIIGKGIMRFHAIYWLAMLLSADLPLPSEIYIHEYLTIDGQKMSKTIGNVIYPAELVNKYGIDGTRYLLLANLPYTSDGDISWEKMTEKFNADLANGLGNLVSRTISMINRYNIKDQISKIKSTSNISKTTSELLKQRKFELALKEIWQGIREQNQFIDQKKPWELAKTDKASLVEVLSYVHAFLRSAAAPLSYFMPETAEKLAKQLESFEPEALFPRI